VHQSAFTLGYEPSYGGWAIVVPSADTDQTVTMAAAYTTTAPQLGRWTHLTGVYDANARTLKLYVDGVPAPVSASNVTLWNAEGQFRIGTGLAGGDGFVGAIDEARAYAGVVPVWHGDWRFESCTGSPVSCVDGGTPAHQVTLTSGATWSPSGKEGSALSVDGTGAAAATAGAVLDTTKSLTVAAWVKPANIAGNRTVLSQQGTNKSFFELGYQSIPNNWCFSVFRTDSAEAVSDQACAAGTVTTGTWVHLIGIYDAQAGTITLHLNGGASMGGQTVTVSHPANWSAGGVLAIGRAWNGGIGAPFNGLIDEVRVYQGIPADLAALM
jgi:hypothetical protein